MFVVGLLLLAIGLAGVFFAIFPPVEAARLGAVGVAVGCGLSGALLAYLDAPSRRREPAPGMHRAKATILDAAGTPGSVAGYQMVELTLEVRPKGGVPFQVKRKFSAGRLGRIEQGRQLDVAYDPANPERLELA
ncbi:MAG TPA: DUF3592 domain-containing protein [Solirubrobacterales bacterium]|nr:DUF3592 domain-containing protein [Solirubrobacterales bacterium]